MVKTGQRDVIMFIYPFLGTVKMQAMGIGVGSTFETELFYFSNVCFLLYIKRSCF